MKPKLIYTKQTEQFIMEALGYSVAEDGYMMKDGKRALTLNGDEILHKNLAGFHRDGLVGSDLGSMMDLVKKE